MMLFPIKKIIAPAVFAFMVLGGCGQKESGPVREQGGPSAEASVQVHGSMTALVNGKPWTAQGSPSEKQLDNVTASIDTRNGEMTIHGISDTYHSIESNRIEEINITLKSIQPGTYTLSPDFDHDQTATYTKGQDSSTVYFIHEHQSGTLTLTRIDTAVHRIFGTFRFDCANAKGEAVKIENGSFDNVKYEE
jgi:hypothetical protein